MFGYVQPLRTELKVQEDILFRSAYCGLCFSLKKNYGFISRLLISYEYTFLAMLLTDTDDQCIACRKRCLIHPFNKRNVQKDTNAFKIAGAANIISGWWKLNDEIRDHKGIKKFGYKFAKLFLKKAYKKAKKILPAFDENMKISTDQLEKYENKKIESIDLPADSFAACLGSLNTLVKDHDQRPIREILYQMGRWIYIVDAIDDFKDDLKNDNYNPIRYRYQTTEITDEIKNELRITLDLSLQRISSGLALLEANGYSPILENTVTKGLYTTQNRILEQKDKKKEEYNERSLRGTRR